MTHVFLDTVGLLALWDVRDQWHAAAEEAMLRIPLACDLVTTSYVLAECGNAAARRTYRSDVVALQNELSASGKLIVPSSSDWEAAWDAYAKGASGDAAIVDNLSFVVMRRMGITDVFTNDRHFAAAGFNVLF